MANEFVKSIKNIERAIKTASNQALKRAGTSTRALYAKEISADLGITAKRAKSRSKVFNPSVDQKNVTLSIGVRLEFAAHDFKPKKIKNVKTRLGKRTGASYTVKGRSTVVVPGAFMIKGAKSGKTVIIQRVGESRYPTKTVLVDVFKKSVLELRPILHRHMLDVFEKNYRSNIKFNLGKL